MQVTRQLGQRRTIWIALSALALWAFLIYWQGEISWNGFTQSLDAILALQFENIPAPFDSLLLDGLLLLAGGFFWMAFFAHFVLPLQKLEQSLKMMAEMGRALLGKSPSTFFLRNGEPLVESKGGRENGPRILLLDSASAAVLRNDTNYTRAVGPGLSFAHPGEHIAGTLDLRIQRRSLGPHPQESPFSVRMKRESAAAFQARQDRRKETSGHTRDGVEVVPRLEVDFRIEGKAQEGRAPYSFQAEFAWRAVAHQGVAPQNPTDTREHRVSWDWLPAHLAADLWREYLRKFKLQELFDEARSSNGGSGLDQVQEFINLRLRKAIVAETIGSTRAGRRKSSSPEYQLLRNRGLRVLGVRLRELHLDPMRDETRLVNEWSEAWEMRAIQSSVENNRRSDEKERMGQKAAAAEFVRRVSTGLFKRLKETDGKTISPPDELESLELLINGSLLGADMLPGLDPGVSKRLQQVVSWLQVAKQHNG